MFNEFFNELAYNPGSNQGGFLFFLDWANHDLNSVVSTADAHGPLGRSLAYFNCERRADPERRSGKSTPRSSCSLGLLNPPTGAACRRRHERENGERARQRRERDGPARRARAACLGKQRPSRAGAPAQRRVGRGG